MTKLSAPSFDRTETTLVRQDYISRVESLTRAVAGIVEELVTMARLDPAILASE